MVDLEATLRASLDGVYVIEGEVGRGGMSVVYRAHDEKHNRTVAIKVLRPELSEQIGTDRFHREIEVVAGLTHPHILPLHDSGEVDGLFYFVMPFIEGESLRGRLDREVRLPVPDAIRITREIAGALGFAHRQGVIHRDVKPGNILLTEDHALLADFGVAHLAESDGGTLTGIGLALGTPSYISPEQSTAERDLDGRSDVYSLGCVLYEALAGEPPFTAASVRGLITKHLVEEPPRLREQRPEVSDGVEAVVQTALQKDPGKRFQTADEMAGSLDLVSGGFEAMAAAALRKLLGPRHRWLHGTRLAVLVAAVVVVVVAGLFAVSSYVRGPTFRGPVATYLLLPVTGGGATAREVQIAERAVRRLWFHLADWTSIRVVDLGTLEGPISDLQLAGLGLPSLNLDAAQRLAERAGASHIVRVQALALGDSISLVATIRELQAPDDGARPIRKDGRAEELDHLTAGVALEILGLHGEPADYPDLLNRSQNHTAQQQFYDGQIALYEWRLAEAEERFRVAVAEDSEFSLAHHYLAQTLYWRTVRDPQRLEDLGPVIERHSRRAEQYGTTQQLRTWELSDVRAFRALWAGDYAGARVLYDSILAFDPTNMEALLLRGSVEVEDPWLAEGSGGLLIPRQDLRKARSMFDSAAYLRPEWQLAMGRLFDIDFQLARAAYEGYCYGFEPPPEEPLPPYVNRPSERQRSFCPLVEGDDVLWMADSIPARRREISARSVQVLHQRTVEWLDRATSVESDQARPHEELVGWMLWERAVPGCSADPLWADSLLGGSREHLERALAIRGDTTPEDRARLASLLLATGDFDSALRHADLTLTDLGDWEGDGAVPPIEVANVYLAAGSSDPTAELIERSWGDSDYSARDPTNGGAAVPGGTVYGTLGALRALGIMGESGAEVERRFDTLDRAWRGGDLTARQQALLRADALMLVSPALVRLPERWPAWFDGWDEYGFEIPSVWMGLLAVARDPAAARRHLEGAVTELEERPARRRRAVHYLLPIELATRIGADSIAADLAARAASCPKAVDRLDFAWGMKDLMAGRSGE